MIFRTLFVLAMVTLCSFRMSAQQASLKKSIETVITPAPGKIGVAVMSFPTGDTLTINNRHHYPMQSVYKLPLAVAVLNDVDKGKLTLDDIIHIRKKDLLPDTWSPLAEKYPNGDVNLKLQDVLKYSVSLSDNNACDILFRLMDGPKKIQQFMNSNGIAEINIANTEEELHEAWDIQYNNWTTPWSMIQLLESLENKDLLSGKSYKVLQKLMMDTPTGKGRLRGALPDSVRVSHKTGTSGDNAGVIAAVNDVGIVYLPNGHAFAIAVFVSDFKGTVEEAESYIAKIARLAYDHYTSE